MARSKAKIHHPHHLGSLRASSFPAPKAAPSAAKKARGQAENAVHRLNKKTVGGKQNVPQPSRRDN